MSAAGEKGLMKHHQPRGLGRDDPGAPIRGLPVVRERRL